MKDEFVKSIGIWGQRHYDYLRKNKPMVINVMRMNGTLERYLQDTDRNAHEKEKYYLPPKLSALIHISAIPSKQQIRTHLQSEKSSDLFCLFY